MKIVSEQSNKMGKMFRIAFTVHKVQYCLKLHSHGGGGSRHLP
jgi:hypothetical protein